MHLLILNSIGVIFLVHPVTYFFLQTPHGPVRYCFTWEIVICWCSYLSSLPPTAFLSVSWTMKYFKTQGRGRQAAARLCCYAHWALILTLAVDLLIRVWYMCIPPPAHRLLILASLCCLGRCAWQSFPSSLGWVGNMKHASFKTLQELLNVKAALRHRCACHGWSGLLCVVMREVQACVAVTGGLQSSLVWALFCTEFVL